ncbi:MAG: DUF3108 domain-containing protein [Candidatus Omnitrophota bacterium]|nr:DUF3108 domain-containing protein [Candidatus Omnitrophota bacterium]
MKKVFIVIIVFLVLAIGVSAYQNNPRIILAHLDAAKLESQAKQLTCKVYFLGLFPVGKAVLRDEGLMRFEGGDSYHLSAQAGVESLIFKIYPFSASIDSYLDPKTLLPVFFRQDIQTKDKVLKKEVRYNQISNVMEIGGEKRTIFPETYEPLSVLHKLRRMDLDKTSNFDLNINTNQKNYAFTGDISKENIQTKSGPVGAYRLKGRIFRRDKNPYHQSKIEIVLLDNGPKTPIFIKVFASGALITVRLIGQSN